VNAGEASGPSSGQSAQDCPEDIAGQEQVRITSAENSFAIHFWKKFIHYKGTVMLAFVDTYVPHMKN